jgi:hypothetical protein
VGQAENGLTAHIRSSAPIAAIITDERPEIGQKRHVHGIIARIPTHAVLNWVD